MTEPCTREDLQAVVPHYDFWTVDEDGNPDETECGGHGAGSAQDVEEYLCTNCGEHFVPNKHWSESAVRLAWEAALKHLTNAKELK